MPLSAELEFHPLVLVTHTDSEPWMKLHLPGLPSGLDPPPGRWDPETIDALGWACGKGAV